MSRKTLTWCRADNLRPGDVQRFAGYRMVVRELRRSGRYVSVTYADRTARSWPGSTQLQIEDRVDA